MRMIDPRWTGLEEGYQVVQALQGKLESEFGRAVQVGQRRKFRRELNDWQKKRRLFIALAVLAPLAVITLCLSAFYFQQVACVIVYWAFLVVIILVALAVAGRQYIQQVVSGPPAPAKPSAGMEALEGRWWASLAPSLPAPLSRKEVPGPVSQLAAGLPDEYLMIASGPTGGQAGLLLVGASGIWLFEPRDWEGTIVKEAGVWKRVGKGSRRPGAAALPPAPDERWIEQKRLLVETLQSRLPHLAWTADLIQGGILFSHPKAAPDKARIEDSQVSYGPARAWIQRLRSAPPVEGFPPGTQMEILETLAGILRPQEPARGESRPARAEAERLYQETAEGLRQALARMVK
jgi:hypothetical protein